ncbi:MAG: O-antigen ligase family protein [Patescibacteria group bacterium]
MFLDRLTENIDVFRQRVVMACFLFLVLIPSFFAGEWIRWLQVAILVAVFPLIIFTIILNTERRPSLRGLGRRLARHPATYAGLFVLVALVTALSSVNRYASLNYGSLLVAYLAIFYCGYLFFRRWDLVRFATIVIFSAGVLAAFISLIQLANQTDPRAGGLLFNANALGSYLLFSVAIGTVLSFAQPGRRRWWFIAGTAVAWLAFVLTYSYTAWVGFLVPLYLLIRWYRHVIFSKRFMAVTLAAVLLAFVALIGYRYVHTKDLGQAVRVYETITLEHFVSSFSQRAYFNQSAFEMFRDHPLTGSGLSTYQLLYARYYHTLSEQPRYTHNYYLQTAAELGIFGFAALVAFVYLLLRRGWRIVRREVDPAKQPYLLALYVAILASSIHSLFDFGWQYPAVYLLFWISGATLLAWGRVEVNSVPIVPQLSTVSSGKLGVVIRAAAAVVAIVLLLRGLTLGVATYYFQQVSVSEKSPEQRAFITYYRQGLRFDPDPVKLADSITDQIHYVGIKMVPKDDLAAMEQRMGRHLRASPQDYYGHWALGLVYLAQDNFDSAIAEYRQAVTYNPAFRPDIYYDLAYVQVQQKKYSAARATILGILQLYPAGMSSSNPNLPLQLAFLNYLLGETYRNEGNIAQARQSYEQALKLTPGLSVASRALKDLGD